MLSFLSMSGAYTRSRSRAIWLSSIFACSLPRACNAARAPAKRLVVAACEFLCAKQKIPGAEQTRDVRHHIPVNHHPAGDADFSEGAFLRHDRFAHARAAN